MNSAQVLEEHGVLPVYMALNAVLLPVLWIAAAAAPQSPMLRWDDFDPPLYPQMARIAHITGFVVLEVTIQPDGTAAISHATGHPILVEAVRDSFRRSKVGCDGCGDDLHTFSVTYEFKIADPPRPAVAATPPPVARPHTIRSIRCMYLWRCAARTQ